MINKVISITSAHWTLSQPSQFLRSESVAASARKPPNASFYSVLLNTIIFPLGEDRTSQDESHIYIKARAVSGWDGEALDRVFGLSFRPLPCFRYALNIPSGLACHDLQNWDSDSGFVHPTPRVLLFLPRRTTSTTTRPRDLQKPPHSTVLLVAYADLDILTSSRWGRSYVSSPRIL